MNINWIELPFNHAGRWESKIPSIMNPGSKVTWPQFIAEMVVFWRTKFLKDYKDIRMGPDWYKAIPKAVRELNQQASVLCNYFPHPDDEPLVIVAFKNFFRKNRPCKIGQYRKTRATKAGTHNITQDEKDVIMGINEELKRLISQREAYMVAMPDNRPETPTPAVFKTMTATQIKKGSLASLLELERKINQAK